MSAPRLCGLERTAVLIQLAASIFYAQVILDQSDETHFEALTPYLKHQYIDLAALVVDSFKPASVTRQGSPAVPPPSAGTDGVTRPVDPLFDLAAGLARGHVLAFPDPRD